MATISVISNEGALESASSVLEVTATNPEYNQPALHIKQAGKRGGAASIKIDDPNPDIEFVETDQVSPAGKYEIAVIKKEWLGGNLICSDYSSFRSNYSHN